MKEFINKLIERLEEIPTKNKCSECPHKKKCDEIEAIDKDEQIDLCGATIKALAIDAVKELAEEYNNCSTDVSTNSSSWIPCSERLPEDGQWVIFTLDEEVVDNDDVMVGYYDARKNWCVNEAYFPNAFRFIAWQPLPEPYKAGD